MFRPRGISHASRVASHGLGSCFNESDFPVLAVIGVNGEFSGLGVDRDVALVQVVVGEVLLDRVALVAEQTNSLKPYEEKAMMCQRMGLPPISTMGFGRISVSSLNRVPTTGKNSDLHELAPCTERLSLRTLIS